MKEISLGAVRAGRDGIFSEPSIFEEKIHPT
jgi:hypothetical protein